MKFGRLCLAVYLIEFCPCEMIGSVPNFVPGFMMHHNIGWNNSQILEFETDYRKRQFIESFFLTTFQIQ